MRRYVDFDYTEPRMRRQDVLKLLHDQLADARLRVERLHHAIQALERLGRRERLRSSRISEAGRRRIAAAQRERWEKFRLLKS